MRARVVVVVALVACALLGSVASCAAIETDFEKLMAKYGGDSALPSNGLHEAATAFARAPWRDEFLSLVEVGTKTDPVTTPAETTATATETGGSNTGTESELVGACEVCVYVVENKEQHQPYLCRGLKDPNYQKACVEVMESMFWWLTNEVYWLNYGCQRDMNGAVEWVRPCPAHAVCSWIEDLYKKTPFCPADPYYKKPQ